MAHSQQGPQIWLRQFAGAITRKGEAATRSERQQGCATPYRRKAAKASNSQLRIASSNV